MATQPPTMATTDETRGDLTPEKAETEPIEKVHTSNGSSNGKMTSDGEDGYGGEELPMTNKRRMALVAQAFLWTGSQIPVYLFGAVPPYIYRELESGRSYWVWFILANLLALAAICPFVGSLSDLFGRRYCALAGATLIVVGMILCSAAPNMDAFIAGMALAGVGAGIEELTALAATSELAPTSQRGKYVAVLIFTIVPFTPSVMWGQLIAYHSSWRYCGLFCALWAFIGLVLTAIFYHPPPRHNSEGLSRKEILGRIDFMGGFLSITGMILFLVGMNAGGYQYPWTSAHVLAPFIIGFCMLVAFVVWELKGAKYPMFPKRLNQAPRTLILTLVITFISGANFFSILMFWPVQAFNVYGHDPVQVGLRGLPVGFGIMFGAVIVLWLLSVFRGHNKLLMIISSVLMTCGCGALAAARVDNLYQVWGILVVAGLGIGGIVVPASIMTTIITPPDLIATVAALTLSIRVIGGSIGYCTYYNVFVSKFVPAATAHIGGVMVQNGLTDPALIGEVIALTSESLIIEIGELPGIAGNEALHNAIIYAGQVAYAEAYVYVYYASIGFGVVSIVAACFLGDIGEYMDDKVAVVM